MDGRPEEGLSNHFSVEIGRPPQIGDREVDDGADGAVGLGRSGTEVFLGGFRAAAGEEAARRGNQEGKFLSHVSKIANFFVLLYVSNVCFEMKIRYLSFLFLAALFFAGCSEKEENDPPVTEPEMEESLLWKDRYLPRATYIGNGTVQIGVDLSRGGGICHFSDSLKKKNLLNHYDTGRFIQQSYYGDEDGSDWNGTAWCYNPVQGGGWKGNAARIVSQKISDTEIEIQTEPVHWASCVALPECLMTETVSLKENYAEIRFQFAYSGGKTHKARHQELPAMFVDWDFSHLVYYAGSSPWTGGAVTDLKVESQGMTGIKNSYLGTSKPLSESWYVWTDDSGYGIGIYSPGTTMCTYYRVGSGPGGSYNVSCSYLAPIRTLSLPADLSYTVYLTTGTVEQIRETFNKIRKQ